MSTIQIEVRTVTKTSIKLTVNKNDTAKELKAAIENTTGIAATSQRLLYGGKELAQSKEISKFGLEDGSIIQLALKGIKSSIDDNQPVPYQIFIQTVTKKFALIVNYNDSIAQIKSKIESKEGIDAKQQRLLYSGRQLKDNHTLDEYFIYDDCILQLVLRLSDVKGQTMQMFSFYLLLLFIFIQSMLLILSLKLCTK